MARLIILRLLDSYVSHRWLNLLAIVLMIGLAGASFTWPSWLLSAAAICPKESATS